MTQIEMTTKKLIANLPRRTHAILKAWADRDGMSMNQLAIFLLKIATDEELNSGRLVLDEGLPKDDEKP